MRIKKRSTNDRCFTSDNGREDGETISSAVSFCTRNDETTASVAADWHYFP